MLIKTLIDEALKEIGVLAADEEAKPSEHEDGLRVFNRLIDSFNSQNLMITHVQEKVYEAPLVVNACTSDGTNTTRAWKNKVSIGQCLDYNEIAPLEIFTAFIRNSETDYTVEVATLTEFSQVANKSTVARPAKMFTQSVNKSMDIFFTTIPEADDVLHAFAKMPFVGSSPIGDDYTIESDIQWDYGYENLLVLNLAVFLSPRYKVPLEATLAVLAQKAIDDIKSSNYTPLTLSMEDSLSFIRYGSNSLITGLRQYR